MGSGMGKYLLEKEGIEIVGVICSTERENGMDLGVLLVTKKRDYLQQHCQCGS